MSLTNPTNLTLTEAQEILKQFDCIKPIPNDSLPQKELIRQALLLVSSQSDYQILGICADTAEQGILALKNYSTALGYEANSELTPIDGTVYIKYNPATGLCYIDSYTGHYRGVLVSCQSANPDGINDMYGHLPLDLFGEN